MSGTGESDPGRAAADETQPGRLRRFGPAAAVLGAVLFAVAVRWIAHLGLDLQDVPGPASAQFVMLAETERYFNWTIWLLASFRSLTGLDPVASAQALMVLAGLLAVAGATMAGGALAGWRGAVGAGAVAAVWSPFVLTSLLVGADAPAAGAAWFGVGLALLASRTRWPGLAMAFTGGLVALLALGIKEVALPAVVLLAVAPFVGRRTWRWRLAHTACLAVGAGLGYHLVTEYLQLGLSVEVSRPGPAAVWDGWGTVLRLREVKGDSGALPDLLALAVLAVALPPYRRVWVRAIALVLAVGAVGVAAAAVGDVTSRQLVASGLGLVVLAGVLLGNAARLLERLGPLRRGIPWGPLRWGIPWGLLLRWVPLVLVTALLGLDTLGLLHSWADLRAAEVGTAPAALPRPPAPWRWRHQHDIYDATTSTIGAVELMQLAREAPPGGIVSPPIPDRREAHLELAAVLAGAPVLVPRPQECCLAGTERQTCAGEVVAALDEAGAMLVLPPRGADGRFDRRRVDDRYWEWITALESEAARRGPFETRSAHWRVWTGRGQGGTLPCPRYAKLYLQAPGEEPPPPVDEPR